MDVRELLSLLELPPGDGYYRSRIPCPEDEQVARVVRAFTEASPGRQAVFREAIDGTRAGLLLVFSERLAALAVRLGSSAPLVQGLVGASLAQEGDPRRARGGGGPARPARGGSGGRGPRGGGRPGGGRGGPAAAPPQRRDPRPGSRPDLRRGRRAYRPRRRPLAGRRPRCRRGA